MSTPLRIHRSDDSPAPVSQEPALTHGTALRLLVAAKLLDWATWLVPDTAEGRDLKVAVERYFLRAYARLRRAHYSNRA